MTALAFHLLPNTTSQEWVDWASKGAPWTKVADAESIARVKANGSRCYWRPYLGGDDGAVPDANAWAKRVIDSVHYTGGVWPDACGFRNEMPANAAQGLNYATYRDRLREAGYTGLVVLGSFSVGTPDWPEWSPMLDAIPGDPPDAIECHEYWADHMGDNAPWYELRHVEAIRRGLIHPETKLFIGECGRDSPPGASPGGWQGVISPERQAANLAAYLAACAPSVQAAFVFADGAGGQWARYATRGTAAEAAIRRTWQGGPAVLQGIDTSNWQPDTDWRLVRQAGNAFAFVLATDGTGFVSPTFARDWQAAKDAGLARGAYHFARVGGDAAGQARRFLAAVGPLGRGDRLWLDMEDPAAPGDVSAWSRAWFAVVDAALGTPAGVYLNRDFIADRGMTRANVGDRELWLAYPDSPGYPGPIGDWGAPTFWQGPTGAVAGVSGPVDLDQTTLSPDGLAAGGYQGGGPVSDVTTRAKANYELLGVGMNPATALSQAYIAWYAMWEAAGKPDASNKGPAIHPEDGDGSDAYLALDDGSIMHAAAASGWHVSAAEYREQRAIRQRFGW